MPALNTVATKIVFLLIDVVTLCEYVWSPCFECWTIPTLQQFAALPNRTWWWWNSECIHFKRTNADFKDAIQAPHMWCFFHPANDRLGCCQHGGTKTTPGSAAKTGPSKPRFQWSPGGLLVNCWFSGVAVYWATRQQSSTVVPRNKGEEAMEYSLAVPRFSLFWSKFATCSGLPSWMISVLSHFLLRFDPWRFFRRPWTDFGRHLAAESWESWTVCQFTGLHEPWEANTWVPRIDFFDSKRIGRVFAHLKHHLKWSSNILFNQSANQQPTNNQPTTNQQPTNNQFFEAQMVRFQVVKLLMDRNSSSTSRMDNDFLVCFFSGKSGGHDLLKKHVKTAWKPETWHQKLLQKASTSTCRTPSLPSLRSTCLEPAPVKGPYTASNICHSFQGGWLVNTKSDVGNWQLTNKMV